MQTLTLRTKTVLTFILFLTTASLFAEEESLSTLITNRDTAAIQTMLENAQPDEQATYEQLIIEASKNAIMNDDFDYAATLTELILLTNLDNAEAQKLFTSIQDAKRKATEIAEKKQKKAAEEQRLAEKKRLEEERQRAEQEAAKQKEEYLQSVSVIDKKNFPISAAVTVASLDFAKSPFADRYTNTSNINSRYGFGAAARVSFVHPYIKAILSGSFAYSPITLSGDGNKTDLNMRLAIGMPSFAGPFALSVGYRRYTTDGDRVALYKIFAGPVLGVGITDVPIINNLSLSFFADFNLMPAIEDTAIDFAFDTALNVRYAFPLKTNMKLFAENETIFDGQVIDSDFEWNVKTAFSVGVSLNDN